MGSRGPLQKPDWLKVIDGDPGKRMKSSTRVGAKPVAHIDPPSWMTGEVLDIWKDVVRVLTSVKALEEGDQYPLQRYVGLLHQYRVAEKFMRENTNGQIVWTVKDPEGKTKKIQLLPHLTAMLRINDHLLKFERHFGMTPAARAMWGAGGSVGDGPEDDPFA